MEQEISQNDLKYLEKKTEKTQWVTLNKSSIYRSVTTTILTINRI